MKKFNDFSVLDEGPFDIVYIHKPPRLEGKVAFNREDLSQKLVFSLMEITHEHGFGCSPPFFQEGDDEVVFLIGTMLPSKKSVNKYSTKLLDCLMDIDEFVEYFMDQLDFTSLDLSMFSDIDFNLFYPEQIASLRDQHYDGSWDLLYEDLIDKRKTGQAALVKKCVEFEEVNQKDMGLVGYKLFTVMQMLKNVPRAREN